MIIFDAQQVYAMMDMQACIEVMRETLTDWAQGRASQPLRSLVTLPDGNIFGFMPAYLGAGDYFGAKVATAFRTNTGTGYPSHMGQVMLLDSAHGSLCALADATAITLMRTAAVSGLATDLLARQDARGLALIGAGAQAAAHLEAMRCVRDIAIVWVYDLSPQRCQAFAREMAAKHDLPVIPCASATQATAQADIICTVTTSPTPVLFAGDVREGAHINAVGAYTPKAREISSDLVKRSRLYADSMDSILGEGGEFLLAKAEGVIDEAHILGDLAGLLLGKVPAREDNGQVTLFDAHGLAIEDVACARYLYLKAKAGQAEGY